MGWIERSGNAFVLCQRVLCHVGVEAIAYSVFFLCIHLFLSRTKYAHERSNMSRRRWSHLSSSALVFGGSESGPKSRRQHVSTHSRWTQGAAKIEVHLLDPRFPCLTTGKGPPTVLVFVPSVQVLAMI